MSERPERHPITMKPVVYEIPGMASAVVRRNEPYRMTPTGPLTMDVYYPSNVVPARRLPAVVVVLGYAPKTPNPLGCAFREMASSIGWGRLLAASGLAAIFYSNQEPEADLRALLHHVREQGESLGIDGHRIGLLATSGNAPLALSMLMQAKREQLECGAMLYPMTLDLDGDTAIAEAAARWGFVTPAAGRTVADLPPDLPLFIARAGRDDFPGLNGAIDRFVAESLRHNLPVTVVNHADGPHAFDLFHDSEASRDIIRQTLRFLQLQLRA